jgi:hypothetical protein
MVFILVSLLKPWGEGVSLLGLSQSRGERRPFKAQLSVRDSCLTVNVFDRAAGMVRRRVDTRPTIPSDRPVSRTFGELVHVNLPAAKFVRVRMWWDENLPVHEITCDNEQAARAFIALHRESALNELESAIWNRLSYPP